MTDNPELADVAARDLLTVDGTGTPESTAFRCAIRALFAVRAALGAAADVPLEGTYAQDGDPLRFDLDRPDGWHWRLALPAPPDAGSAGVGAAAQRFGAPVQLRSAQAQRVVRMLHRGPYADEGPSLATLYAAVDELGLVPAGAHTEVYLTDPTSTPPAELRTVLQVPVR